MPNNTPNNNKIPYGYCHCGCGELAPIAKRTRSDLGYTKGEPVRFIHGHNPRLKTSFTSPNPSGLCLCGCGQVTDIAAGTDTNCGWVKGFSKPFVNSVHAKRHSINDRFWRKVNKCAHDDCWEWQAHKDRKGYGKFSVHGKQEKAHRYSYVLHKGPIPEGMFVCHMCDNPSCVNPSHLWVGDAQENTSDMVSKGRGKYNYGDDHHRAVFTNEQVNEIKQRHFDMGIGVVQLAREYGVHRSTIQRLLKNITYQNV